LDDPKYRIGNDWLARANGGQMALDLNSNGIATRVFVSTNYGRLKSVDPGNGAVTDLASFDKD